MFEYVGDKSDSEIEIVEDPRLALRRLLENYYARERFAMALGHAVLLTGIAIGWVVIFYLRW